MPVTGIEHQVDPVDAVHRLGGDRRRVDRTIAEAEELERDADSNLVGPVAGQLQRVASRRKGPARLEPGRSRRDRQQVGRAEILADLQSRPQVILDQMAIHPSVGSNRQGDAVEREDLLRSNQFRGGPHLAAVVEQPLGASLAPAVAGVPRNRAQRPGGRRHQGGAIQIDPRSHMSRITPKVRPATRYLRATTIRTSGIDIAITPDAAMSFQMISNWVTRPWTPTGKVWAFGVAVRISAKRNSLQAKVNTIVAAAIKPGAASGSSTRRNAVHRLAPSTRAASSSSSGISAKKPLSIQMAKGRLKSE